MKTPEEILELNFYKPKETLQHYDNIITCMEDYAEQFKGDDVRDFKKLNKAHVSSSFICDECKNKMDWNMLCEVCSSVGQIMEDGGVFRTHDICNDCCRCREYGK